MNKVFNNQQLLFEEKDGISSVPEQLLPTTLRVSQVEDNPVFVDFEGGTLSSDAGTLLLREVETLCQNKSSLLLVARKRDT